MPVSLERLAQAAVDLLAPLPSYFASPDAASEIFQRLGYAADGAALAPAAADLGKLADDINKLVDEAEQFATARAGGQAGYPELLELIGEIALVIEDLSKLPADLGALNLSPSFFTDLLTLLFVDLLDQQVPALRASLEFIGIIEQAYIPAQVGGPAVGYRATSVHWNRLIDLVQQPKTWASGMYGWGTANFAHAVFLLRLSAILDAFGLFAPVAEIPPDILDTFFPSGKTALSRPQALKLPLYHLEPDLDTEIEAGFLGLPVDGKQAPTDQDTGIALMPYAEGAVEGTVAVTPELDFVYSGSADVAGGIVLAIRPNSGLDISLGGQSNVASSGKLRLELQAKPAQGSDALVLLGEAGELRLDTQKLFFGGGVSVMDMKPDAMIELGVSGGRLVITMSQADGFLAKVLPPDGIQFKFDFLVQWSQSKGLHFEGGAALETTLALNVSLGPVLLKSLWISFGVSADGVTLQAAVTASAVVGPISASIDKIGLKLFLNFVSGNKGNLGPVDLGLGFKPPTGLGIAIDAGPVTGGGYIDFDPDNGRYAGVLALSLVTISIKAIALLDTRLPGGQSGFSFLIIISVEFSPIQLGFGITLNGVGGLAGINRTMVAAAIQAGIRNHTCDHILFPKDPINNAPQIISDLRTIFPPAEGRYVFGPMLKLGWETLVDVELGVIIEVPSPVVIAILGQLNMLLPEKDAAVVELHLDLIGVIDFGKKLFSLDATLHDSRIVVFTLFGDMAMRLSWGDNPTFLFSIGGWNPHFQAPPNFPALRPLTLALQYGDNVRLTMQMYVAVTSNSFQLGAHLEIYVGAGDFNLDGWLGFDALIIFSPFSFRVDISAGIALRAGDSVLGGIRLTGVLSGPTPWHAEGEAHFSILFFDVGIHFSVTSGDSATNPLPSTNAWDPLSKAIAAPTSWSGALPPGTTQVVTIAAPEGADAPVLIEPSGTLTLRERVLPLNQKLTKFGEAVPDQQDEFDLAQVMLGTSAVPFTVVTDNFARGAFQRLSDSDKLTLPSYEQMPAGFSVGDGAVDFGTSYSVDIEFETVIVDSPTLAHHAPNRYALSGASLRAQSLTGAGARSLKRITGLAAYAPDRRDPPLAELPDEQYVIAGVDDMARRDDITVPTTKGQAYDALAKHVAGNPAERGKLQVVPLYELAEAA